MLRYLAIITILFIGLLFIGTAHAGLLDSTSLGPVPLSAEPPTASGTLYGWGRNAYGQFFGQGHCRDEAIPVPLMSNVVDAAVNRWGRVIALRDDGTVWEWGGYWCFNRTDKYAGIPSPVQITSIPNGPVDITAAYDLFAFLYADGSVWWYRPRKGVPTGTEPAGEIPVGGAGFASPVVQFHGSFMDGYYHDYFWFLDANGDLGFVGVRPYNGGWPDDYVVFNNILSTAPSRYDYCYNGIGTRWWMGTLYPKRNVVSCPEPIAGKIISDIGQGSSGRVVGLVFNDGTQATCFSQLMITYDASLDPRSGLYCEWEVPGSPSYGGASITGVQGITETFHNENASYPWYQWVNLSVAYTSSDGKDRVWYYGSNPDFDVLTPSVSSTQLTGVSMNQSASCPLSGLGNDPDGPGNKRYIFGAWYFWDSPYPMLARVYRLKSDGVIDELEYHRDANNNVNIITNPTTYTGVTRLIPTFDCSRYFIKP